MKYSEYFDIDPAYYPEINPNSVKDPELHWQKTFPHKTFIDLLEATERMLARETGRDKHGIWVEGAYGTGKSRVIWTLQNILTCSKEELLGYFNSFDELREKPDLLSKLIAHKEGRIVTASRYGSGEISSIRHFITAVYDSVTRALKDAEIDYHGQRTLRGGIAGWLEDEANRDFFEKKIKKPEYRGLGSLNGRTADEIITQLRNLNASVDDLLDDILTLADREGISAFTMDMDDLKSWLTDVIDENNLKAVVLFWDEFSSFFKNHKTSLDTFQSLAELADNKAFYMIIVTHMSGELAGPSEQGAFKIVYDRFVHNNIEMPDNIAFKLIRYAMRVKEAAREEYQELTENLNSLMPASRKAVCEQVGIGEEVMRGIFPIHPMAALLLKYISTQFASNQRSMFNFIKNDDSDNLQAFQWFINNHSPEDDEILTIDYLWNFFYERGKDGNSSAVGRNNLDIVVASILDTYPRTRNKQNSLTRDEERVLKTVLMMQAISKKLNNGVELFRPTDKNINLAFEGVDDLDNNRAVNIIRNMLVKKGILYIDSNGKVDEYAAAAVAGDQAQIDAIKERLRKETKTNGLLTACEIETAFSFPASIRTRYDFTNVTVDNFTPLINRITNEPRTYRLRSVIGYARSEDEQKKMRSLIEAAVREERYREIIFIDASSNIMGVERFDRYIDVAAQEEYWRPKDGELANNKEKNKKELLDEWKNIISNGSFVAYSFGGGAAPCNSTASLNGELANLVLKKYPLSFDNAKVTEALFNTAFYSDAAKRGIRMREKVDFSKPGIFGKDNVCNMLEGVLGVDDYVHKCPNTIIAKIKAKLDEMIQGTFKDDVRISIRTIFDYLMELGFMPCPMYAFLAGFLLSEYSREPYRYSEGTAGDNGGVMNVDKLGDMIGEYVKHKNTSVRNYRERYIEIMTKAQKAFVDFAYGVLGVPENLSVEQTASRMRGKLKDIGYPLWCFKCIDTNSLDDFIDNLSNIANDKSVGSVPELADRFGRMLLKVPSASKNLAALLTEGNGQKAMTEFLQGFENGKLLSIAQSIGIQDVMIDVRRRIGSGEALWLWDKDTGVEELKKLLLDYKIICCSNDFELVSRSASFSGCMRAWSDYIHFLRIPYSLCRAKIPELAYFFECLKNIAEDGDLPHDKREKFLVELETKSPVIAALKDRKMEVFKEEYSIYLFGFNEDEIARLYSKLPPSSYTDDKSAYEKNVSDIAEKIRSEQNHFRLLALWAKLTQTSTPDEWCDTRQTPILAMVPPAELQNAVRLFYALNHNNADKKEVAFALDYLMKRPAFIADLNDRTKIEVAFARCVIDRYSTVLTDNAEVRQHLKKHVPVGCSQWYGNPTVTSEIKKMARSRYVNGGNSAVMKRIDTMSAGEAKALLKELVKDDVEVGISIIDREGE